MYLVPSASPELIDENEFDFHSISTPIASAMDCKQPLLQRPLRGLSSIEPALDLMSTTGLLLDLQPQKHSANVAESQLPQLQLQQLHPIKMEPLVDLGNIFDELELPQLHCTAAPDAMMQPDQQLQQLAAAATATAVGSRVDSISPQTSVSSYPKNDNDMIQDFEDFLSSDDAAYSSDSSGGEPSFGGAAYNANNNTYNTTTTTTAATPAPSTIMASFAHKGGAVRCSARTKTTRTARADKSSAAAGKTTSSFSPTDTGFFPSSASSSSSSSSAATSAAGLAAANKKPRKGWKCSCAFLVTSITQRERAKLLKAGVTPPPLGTDPATLTKAQERELRGALRKIRNVASAQKSRRNQKDYIAALEKEAAAKDYAIQSLEGEVEEMVDTNQSLLSQLGELRSLLYGGGAGSSSSSRTADGSVGSGAGGSALLMLAVCCGIGFSAQDPSTTVSAAAAGFGFDLGMAAIGSSSSSTQSSAEDGVYYTTNFSGGDGGGGGGGGSVFKPTGFKSRTLQSIAEDYDADVAGPSGAAAAGGVGAAGGGWMMLAYVALAAW